MPSINIEPITIRIARKGGEDGEEVPWLRVLSVASTLQQTLPGAVLGSDISAAIFGMHRHARHVDLLIPGLTFRMGEALSALERRRMWRTSLPGRGGDLIRGTLRGVEVEIGDFSRRAPLQVGRALVESVGLVVPTPQETLRLKADLALGRSVWRDFVDLGALYGVLGREVAEEAFAEYDTLHGFGRVNDLRARLLDDLPDVDTTTFPVVNASRCEEFYVVDHCCSLAALLRRWATSAGRAVQ